MDEKRFDEITRALARGIPRRGVLRGLLGGVAAAATVDRASADSPQRKCKQASRPCSFDTHCCSGTCCNHRCCGPDEVCDDNGECVPPCVPDNAAACAGRECGSAENNCGQTVPCGGICTGTGEVCTVAGQCVCTPDNAAACAGRECGSAVNNCGATVDCGTCLSGETCCSDQCTACLIDPITGLCIPGACA
jgi:hypothetical protein